MKAAEIIKECLKEKGISQRQLAACMGEDVRQLNQQLNRRNDMKVGRFEDVLDAIGYSLAVVDNNGIRKVSKEFAMKVIEERVPEGQFYYCTDDGYVIGIDNTTKDAWVEEFWNKEECMKWFRGEPAIDAEGIVHGE